MSRIALAGRPTSRGIGRAPVPARMRVRVAVVVITAAAFAAGCGDGDAGEDASAATTASASTTPPDASAAAEFDARIAALTDAVDRWSSATSLASARAAAEEAANLVVGTDGPGFGDRDGNGAVGASVTPGLLPGADGTPTGLANALAAVLATDPDACGDADVLANDVLGGDWDDPTARWAAMDDAIAAWTPSQNTMPTLPSHPMRVVGWATFTIALTDDDPRALETAVEYAGHAHLHVDVASRAHTCAGA